ncbi:MAG: thiamine pyrophosphate-binding protein [Lachnospiraceae bacterium]|nr:thiamine pyrophosphate-binding protein [Lachnospiraceae bacterium]
MKLSDYIFQFLVEKGVQHTFLLTGGGIMHLVESLGNSNLEYVCCHHEQACAIAAQAYAMYRNDMGVCLVTTGPGGTNALTGAAAAYVDSTPVLFLSGQVKRSDFASLRRVRQFGAQENDIIAMVKPVTKYAALVEQPEDILYHLEKAFYYAMEGRRGPVWLDIPLDVQAAEIDVEKLKHFTPSKEQNDTSIAEAVQHTCRLLQEAKRPLCLLGHGLDASGSKELFREINERLRIPTLSTWRALDVYDWEDELFFGSPGLQAPRYSNLIQQGADFVLVLGSRLDNMITAFNEEHFAFRARKVVVDIDKKELEKLALIECHFVNADVGDFLQCLKQELAGYAMPDFAPWGEWCRRMKCTYPLLKEKQDYREDQADLYDVVDQISGHCQSEDALVISSTSRCNTAGHIAFRRKRGQRSVSSMGMGSMGFALPSAVGAYFASDKNRVIMLEGDGSLQLNLQEFQTIIHYGINVKMFVFCNSGYAAIATMQERNFDGHYVGSNPESGVSMPDLKKIADAYGIPYYSIAGHEEAETIIGQVLAESGAVICEIRGSMKFDEIPKCISSVNAEGQRISAYLENPYPFLPEEEMEDIYIEMNKLC